MSQITSIQPQVKDKNRCSIYVDGVFYCGIKVEVALKYHLKVGMEIEKSKLDEIQLETEKLQAMDKAMTHLSATMKTEKQMLDFLSGKGYTKLVCEYVLEKLKYYGYVDDFLYCKQYVSSISGKGKMALERDLIKRGAKREAIEEALDGVEENAEEVFALLTKYMRGKKRDRQTLYKAFKYLLSKGYSYDTVNGAIDEFGGADEQDNF